MKTLQEIIFGAAPQAYYVGGALRDSILKRWSGDIDLAMPREYVKPAAIKLAKVLKGTAFEMDPDFCVWRISSKSGLQIDLCAFVGLDIKTDLKRRDFTINALAYPVAQRPTVKTRKDAKKTMILLGGIKKEYILDLNGGISDISDKIIKANNANIFTEDPLRLLRAFRTAAELKFNIDKHTLSKIKKNSSLIIKPAGERLQEELKRIFKADNTRYYLEAMDKAGLLRALFPELEKQKDCAECYYGNGGVFTHTMSVLDRIEFLLKNLKKAFPKFYKKLAAFTDDVTVYKMAALLHDIAKPATAKVMQDRLRFFYHEEQGAVMAEEILKNLKYSSQEQRLISKMIEFHLRPSNLASNEIITDRGVYKFFKELGPAGIPMLLLCWADYTSYVTPAQVKRLMLKSSGPVITIEEGKKRGSLGKTLRHMQMVNLLFHKYFNEAKRIILPRRYITGKDVMDVLKMAPGPKVGEILEHVSIAQVEGLVNNKDEAVLYLVENKNKF